ncbi:MAG: hypothetical protein ACFFDR_14480 [Candidatus Thorarchaeota archaeon]
MASNYDSDFEFGDSPTEAQQKLSSWNTWTNRSILKSLSGICFAFSFFGIAYMVLFPGVYIPSLQTLLLFSFGLILWGLFYTMEREYRKVTPNRIR